MAEMDPYLQQEKASWEIMSEDETYRKIPSFEDNEFLKLLDREGMLDPGFDVLDIGCGAAVYSIAMKDRVHSCLGLDFSDRMLENARDLIRRSGAKNIRLLSGSWEELDLDEMQMRERFDLVFSHTTPAIVDEASVQKLMDASRRYCAVCLFARVSQPVADGIRSLLKLHPEVPQRISRIEEGVPKLFSYLYREGYYPQVHYEDSPYVFRQTLQNAIRYYTADARKIRPLSDAEEARIREYLTELSADGMVEEAMSPCLVTFYWDKTRRKRFR